MTYTLSGKVHWRDLLQCPMCKQGSLDNRAESLVCAVCSASFPQSGGRPILLRSDNDLFAISAYLQAKHDRRPTSEGWMRWVPNPSVNLARTRVLNQLRSRLDIAGPSAILVVGGGRQRAWLDPLLCAAQAHQVVYSDIDTGASVDLFCDAHDLPFVDGAFDAVVTTAVLEHVLYPERAAAEITRVLKFDGLLYSELPFMQQVHEGAYDFTRYTLSGHRRLFNQFTELDTGLVAGPATAFVWALENLALAFVAHPTLRKLAKLSVRLGAGWIKYIDYFLAHKTQAMDGASCTYFYGSKTQVQVADIEIITRYVGAKDLQHV